MIFFVDQEYITILYMFLQLGNHFFDSRGLLYEYWCVGVIKIMFGLNVGEPAYILFFMYHHIITAING